MIIGIDASRANREQKTGVEWYAFHLFEQMKKSKIINHKSEIKFVLYSDVPLRGELAELQEGWSSKVLKWPPKRLWTQVRLSWEMLVHPPDVLFIPAHVAPVVHPKKTVVMVHDVGAVRFPESYNWFQRWYAVWGARKALNHLWKVIVPSEFTKKELASLQVGKFASEKTHVIQHGYDTRYCKKDIGDIEKILEKYSINTPFILCVGRLEEKKNTVRLIEAFEFLKQNLPHRQASYTLLFTD